MQANQTIDYPAASAALQARMARLLTREKLERMLDAPDAAAAWKTAVQCGYPPLERDTPEDAEHALARSREALYREVYAMAPDRRVVDLFALKYDCHNAKAALKTEDNAHAERLFIACGRYPVEPLLQGEYGAFSPALRRALTAAKEELAQSGDAQRADALLERACFEEMTALAAETGSAFLRGYVALQIDAVNLRTLVRALRAGYERDALTGALLPGGTVGAARLSGANGAALAELFRGSPLAHAAELAPPLLSGAAGLGELERRCDDALMAYLHRACTAPFGEQVVAAYLGAKESEFAALRMVMAGKYAGVDAQTIAARLRETYL